MAKKKYSLVGVDGNAFFIMGYVKNAMKECKFSKKEINNYLSKATSGDYNNLVCVSADVIDECNKRGK